MVLVKDFWGNCWDFGKGSCLWDFVSSVLSRTHWWFSLAKGINTPQSPFLLAHSLVGYLSPQRVRRSKIQPSKSYHSSTPVQTCAPNVQLWISESCHRDACICNAELWSIFFPSSLMCHIELNGLTLNPPSGGQYLVLPGQRGITRSPFSPG